MLPIIDLHRHIEGAVRLSTILDLGRKFNLPLPGSDIESLRPHVQVTDPQPGVMAFIARFKWAVGVMVDYVSCQRIAYETVMDASNEGLDYIELRFSPWFMAEPHSLNPEGVVEAVIDGVRSARENTAMMVNLIGILSRTYGPSVAWEELGALLRYKDHMVGLDLAGDEANYPGDLFEGHFRVAREAGWQITVHAGEAAGPESIWQAVRELGASRIGHAVHAPEDQALMAYLAENRIGIEANLTSNVQTMTVSDYASHPLKFFLESGLLATINTDDPAISGIDLAHEYHFAAPAAGLSQEQINQTRRNALEIAFLSAEEKEKLTANNTAYDQ
jgi:adenosine deaminase